MISTKLDMALHYAALGIPVLPLHYITPAGACSCGGKATNPQCKPGKHPAAQLVPHGLKDATTDSGTVRRWFDGTPYNVGICTGQVSGYFVLDRDDRDGGAASLAALEAKHAPLPQTLTQRTGNGVHYLFRMPSGQDVKNSARKLAAGLDIRGTGGYVVGAPSVHENGRTYTWETTDLPTLDMIAAAPSWLLQLLDAGKTLPPSNATNALAGGLGFHVPDKIENGEGREDFLLRYAGHLRRNGNDQAIIERVLLDFNHLHVIPPLADEVVLDRARRYEGAGGIPAANDGDWPEPEEVANTLPPVPSFNLELVPPALRDWLGDIAERMQCPVEYLAVGALVAAGAVIGNRIGVQPKRLDIGWVEVPNLWGAVVGRPGVMKTPALAQVLAPLKRLEANALAAFDATRRQYDLDRMQYDATRKRIEGEIKKGASVLPGQLPAEPEEPQPPRLLLNDATYQKLGEVLSGNANGVMVFQDELSGLLVRLDADGQEAARAFYLEAWNGQQAYTFDRIGRGTVRIPRLCFSLLGGLQPSKLREYLRNAVYGGKGDDGLAQRLQLLVYPDISREWNRVDRCPDLAAAEKADAVFGQLANLDPAALGAHMPLVDGIPVLGFSDDAQTLFNYWWELLERKMRKGEQHPALESHMSKYRKLVPALALLDHLIAGGSGGIAKESLARAIRWQALLFEHAKRAYAAVTSATMDSAKSLADRVRSGALKDGFTVRDVYRRNWSMLNTTKEAAEAVAILVDLGWLRAVQDARQPGTDGRPTVRYIVNPRLRAAA